MKPWKKRHGLPGGPGKQSEALAWLDKPCPTCGSEAGRNCTTGLPYRHRLKPGQSHTARRPACEHPSVDVKGNEAFCWACRRVFDYAAWQERTVVWSATKGFNHKHRANSNLEAKE